MIGSYQAGVRGQHSSTDPPGIRIDRALSSHSLELELEFVPQETHKHSSKDSPGTPDRPSSVLILIPTSGNTQPRWVPCSRIKQREAKLIHPSKNPPHDFILQKFLHIHIFLGNSPNAI